jgi:colanic acid biosynthesis glycosyl transferase WcaI
MKNIFIVTQWFPPEHAPIGHMLKELAVSLTTDGWEVTVVTGFPNHPQGTIFEGYRKRAFKQEFVSGIRVWRVYLYTAPNPSKLDRILSFLSFTLTSFLVILIKGKPQVLFAVFQPLTIAIPLRLLAFVKKAKTVLNVQDIHPDAAVELGLIKNKLVISMLQRIERYGYKTSDSLTVISEGFKSHCVARGATTDKVAVIENWIDVDDVVPSDRINSFRSSMNFTSKDFVVLYAGTIGYVSGARIMVDVACALQIDPRIKILFVGGGPALEEIKNEVGTLGLTNVVFAPFQDRSRLVDVQATADVSIVSMLPGKGRTSVPSKLLGYMAAARPVVASVDIDSDTARLVEVAGCGKVVQPGQAKLLASAITGYLLNNASRISDGLRGRHYLISRYDKDSVTRRYRALFHSLIS